MCHFSELALGACTGACIAPVCKLLTENTSSALKAAQTVLACSLVKCFSFPSQTFYCRFFFLELI